MTGTPDPFEPGAPIGGYTYDPRPGYSDYPDRYVSARAHGPRTTGADLLPIPAQT